MGVAERRAREKEELRQKILDAAGQLFVEEGFANVSVRKIADRIEYSPATIYLYFKDKTELFSSLCWETFSGLKAELDRLEGEAGDPLAGLRRGLRAYIDFGIAHPNHYLLTFCTPVDHSAGKVMDNFQEINRVGLETFDHLQRALDRCRQSGQLAFEDLNTTSQVVWTFIHGTTSLLILNSGDPHFPWVPPEQLIESSLDLILRGLSPAR
ncbi:MAG: TetR/AcrR family transcriptional regulator [Bryobacterales bacterium]|nr:TetR/AcrR family transcriptional regulator [Bryobacterales bacterium]